MSDTTNLRLPLLEAAQAQKHVTVNEALMRLDALVALSVLDRVRTNAPATPADGDRHIVAAGATGAWADQDGAVAAWQDGAWTFLSPRTGWRAHVADEGRVVWWTGAAWTPALMRTPFGASLRAEILEEEHVLATGPTSDSTIEIPDRAIVLGVTLVVSEAISGAASFDAGVPGATDRYGSGIGGAFNSSNNGISGQPVGYFGATPIRFTAIGGDFNGGKVRVAVHYLMLGIPDFV